MKRIKLISFLMVALSLNSFDIKASFRDEMPKEDESRMIIKADNLLEDSPITQLPRELFYYTFVYLDAKDLISLESVCYCFARVVKKVWENQEKEIYFSDITSEKISKFVTDSRPFRYLNISKPSFIKTNLSPEIFTLLSAKTSLEKLDISGNILYTPQLTQLSTLTNLTSLSMNRTIILDFSSEALQCIASLTKLTHLELSANQLGPNSLQHLTKLTNLQQLDVSNNFAIDNNSIQYLKLLPQLKTLDVYNTGLKTEVVQQLVNELHF